MHASWTEGLPGPGKIALVLLLAGIVLQAWGNDRPHRAPQPGDPETSPTATGRTGPVWAVDPVDPGPNLPPVGRSLFDFLITTGAGAAQRYQVPLPFSELLKEIETRLSADHAAQSLTRVLIPLNRSLQRHGAGSEVFRYPRAVVAVVGEPSASPKDAGTLFKDRLFLGYQEKTGVLEVISYNEAAGRFEFQIVRDYRPGGAPQVFYANRALCTACHQNQAPIFSSPPWEETINNEKIVKLLKAQGRTFYGFPLRKSRDIPEDFDQATDRANALASYQFLWRDGCERIGAQADSIACRANLFRSLLQYRLNRSRDFDRRAPRYIRQLVPFLISRWGELLPQGLLLPSSDIPSRNPFLHLAQSDQRLLEKVMAPEEAKSIWDSLGRRPDIRSIYEPTVLRPPKETWSLSAENTESLVRAIEGLSSFVADVDTHRLDEHLFRNAQEGDHSEQHYRTACRYEVTVQPQSVERISLDCGQSNGSMPDSDEGFAMKGLMYVKAGATLEGSIESLSFRDGNKLRELDVRGTEVKQGAAHKTWRLQVTTKFTKLHARRADGKAIRRLTVTWDLPKKPLKLGFPTSLAGHALMTVIDDFKMVDTVIDEMARQTRSGESDVFSAKPFRRASAMKALFDILGMAPLTWCCLDERGLPPPLLIHGANQPDQDLGTNAAEGDSIIRSFHQHCAECHQGIDDFPPNFLHGSHSQVRENLSHCAERIFFRLEMWRLNPSDRPETPMPPATAAYRHAVLHGHGPPDNDLEALKNFVADHLESRTGLTPRLEDFMKRDYDNLRECSPNRANQLAVHD